MERHNIMKKVIAACIDQILEFDTREELEEFYEKLYKSKQKFQVCTECCADGNKWIIRIQKQYNSCPMIDDKD